ncbi:MAG: hypothetical protein NZ781_10090 [Armatimonadetes bacterium]|nr:hypothetical protein [Armatimonadota bacterium]
MRLDGIEGSISAAVCVWALSLTALSFEVVLTRLFSVVFHYHFSFLSISLSLCGLGIGGYMAHIARRSRGDDKLGMSLWIALTLYPVSLTFVPLGLFRLLLPIGAAMKGVVAVVFIVAVSGLAAMLPFLCVGFSLSILFERHHRISGALYAADLFGAALGCVLAVWMLNTLGGINATLLISACAAAPAMIVSLNHVAGLWSSAHTRFSIAASASVLIIVLLTFFYNRVASSPLIDIPKLKRTHGILIKPLWVELADPSQRQRIVWTKWDAFGRTDVVHGETDKSVMHIYTDGHNPSLMLRFDGDIGKMAEWKRFIGFLPYMVRKPERVLCLGSGGGLDVLLALLGGAKFVDAVDVNTALPELMERFESFNGGIYKLSGVRFHVIDGRSFVGRRSRHYDLLFSALTQTAAAGGLGVALVESYIHTLEACRDYIEALSDDGMIAMILQEPMLALRWWVTCIRALSQMLGKGESECVTHTAVLSVKRAVMPMTPYRYIVLVSKRPFSKDELLRLADGANQLSLEGLLIPGIIEVDPFDLIHSGRMSLKDIVERFSSIANISPATDESPFFLDLSTGIPVTLWVLVGFSLALFLFFIPCSLSVELKAARTGGRVAIATLIAASLYFGMLGIGYMLIEVALLQRLSMPLAMPTQALSLLLVSLLIGSSLGSALSQRLSSYKSFAACASLSSLTIVVIAFLWSIGMGKCVEYLLSINSMARLALLSFLLIITGVPMGMPFPCGLRLLSLLRKELVPYSWGVNGVMSVVGSLATVMLGKLCGFSKAMFVGGLAYILAGVLVLLFVRIGVAYSSCFAEPKCD